MGARVIAAASTAEKLAVAREHGADASSTTHGEAHRARDGADGRQGRRRVLRSRSAAICRRRAVLARLGRAHAARGLRGRRAADPRQPAPREEPLGARLLAPVLPLARAGQAPALGRRAAAVVSGGQAQAVRHATGCRSSEAPRPSGSSPTARRTARSSSCRAPRADRGAPPWRSASRRTARTSPSSPSTISPAAMP